jgi:hypothetical protein
MSQGRGWRHLLEGVTVLAHSRANRVAPRRAKYLMQHQHSGTHGAWQNDGVRELARRAVRAQPCGSPRITTGSTCRRRPRKAYLSATTSWSRSPKRTIFRSQSTYNAIGINWSFQAPTGSSQSQETTSSVPSLRRQLGRQVHGVIGSSRGGHSRGCPSAHESCLDSEKPPVCLAARGGHLESNLNHNPERTPTAIRAVVRSQGNPELNRGPALGFPRVASTSSCGAW